MIPPIVSLEDLDQLDPAPIFCDVRYSLQQPDGYADYLESHLPAARYVSMDDVLAASPGPGVGRHPLPTAEHFAQQLGRLGIGIHDTVIGYDSVGGRFAGRLVWMLRILGQSAALLDGGMDAWQAAGRAFSQGPEDWSPVTRPALPWPEDAIVNADDLPGIQQSGGRIFDSRAAARYRGEQEPLDPKAGHIPGAYNLPFAENYRDGGNHFLPLAALRERFESAGVDGQSVFYCGSGVTACNNVLAAEAAGLPRPRVYVGSWSGWSSEDRPVAVGQPNRQ